MAFSLSGTTISQTGTDTDASGLSGNGATITILGSTPRIKTIYNLEGNKITVGGTFSLDPVKEMIGGVNGGKMIEVLNNGTFNLGTEDTVNSVETTYPAEGVVGAGQSANNPSAG